MSQYTTTAYPVSGHFYMIPSRSLTFSVPLNLKWFLEADRQWTHLVTWKQHVSTRLATSIQLCAVLWRGQNPFISTHGTENTLKLYAHESTKNTGNISFKFKNISQSDTEIYLGGSLANCPQRIQPFHRYWTLDTLNSSFSESDRVIETNLSYMVFEEPKQLIWRAVRDRVL